MITKITLLTMKMIISLKTIIKYKLIMIKNNNDKDDNKDDFVIFEGQNEEKVFCRQVASPSLATGFYLIVFNSFFSFNLI